MFGSKLFAAVPVTYGSSGMHYGSATIRLYCRAGMAGEGSRDIGRSEPGIFIGFTVLPRERRAFCEFAVVLLLAGEFAAGFLNPGSTGDFRIVGVSAPL